MDDRRNEGSGCLFLIASLIIGALVICLYLEGERKGRMVDDLQRQNQELRAELDAMAAQMGEHQATSQALEAQIEGLQAEKALMQQALIQTRAEEETLDDQVQTLEMEKQQLVAYVQVLARDKALLAQEAQTAQAGWDDCQVALNQQLGPLEKLGVALSAIVPDTLDRLGGPQVSALLFLGLAAGAPTLGLGVYYLRRQEGRAQRTPRRSAAARHRPVADQA